MDTTEGGAFPMKQRKASTKARAGAHLSHRRMRGGDPVQGGRPCAADHAGLAALAVALALAGCGPVNPIPLAAGPIEALARPSPVRVGPLLKCKPSK